MRRRRVATIRAYSVGRDEARSFAYIGGAVETPASAGKTKLWLA
jgi:hypothetical protein